MPPVDRRVAPLAPAALAGLVLLVEGVALLLTGGAVSLGSPAQVDLWFVGVGLIVLLGALLATLAGIGDAPVEAPDPIVSRARLRSPTAPSDSLTGVFDPSPGAVPSRSPLARAARPAFTVASSIPAQFDGPARASGVSPGRSAQWDEGTAPAISLPFSAVGPADGPVLGRGYAEVDTDSSPGPMVYLAQEVERLRERVRELEAPDPGRWGGLAATGSPPATTRPSGPRPPEPPSLDGRTAGRLCAGCGSGLPGGATDPLCWGCGRPLCATCYWRTKEGAAAHTCPACFARTGGTATSGGRAPPIASGPSSRTVAPSATPPR
jgi:hypothetical protein